MKLFVAAVLFVATSASAQDTDWCVWDGEDYLKTAVTGKNGVHWLTAVYNLHTDKDTVDLNTDFEGVGSCRFIDRALGDTAENTIGAYLKSVTADIIPSRAYLKWAAGAPGEATIVLPTAYYSAATNWLVVQKDFYSMNRPQCEKQVKQMVDIGQNSSGGIRFGDTSVKKHKNGGISVIIDENTFSTNYFGVCHFHSF